MDLGYREFDPYNQRPEMRSLVRVIDSCFVEPE